MNKNLLSTGVQEFIIKNIDADIMSVLLKKSIFKGVSSKELAQQIEGRKKCQKKLPTWFNASQIYYPKKINLEQSSSEQTAAYKSKIVAGKSLIDLTGGFGVDSYFFSQKIEQVVHCEITPELSQIASHNFEILAVKNISTISVDGLDFLSRSNKHFDWIFIDPSRRSISNRKVYHLSDCLPDVTVHLKSLLSKSKHILIKTSPFLDISSGVKSLTYVKEVHIIAIQNEVKELLWLIDPSFKGEIQIKTINFAASQTQHFNFKKKDENEASSTFSPPLKYLYEPNAAILKSGAFKLISSNFKLHKLHQHTHLYTSNSLIRFPGRIFSVEHSISYSKKALKLLGFQKANLSSRNFPDSMELIKKKHNLKDGGQEYLFFIKIANKNADELRVLHCRKTKFLNLK